MSLTLSTKHCTWRCETVSREKHSNGIKAFLRNNRAHISVGVIYPESAFVEDNQPFVDSFIQRIQSPNNFIMVVEKDQLPESSHVVDGVIGLCGLKPNNEIGYFIDKDFEGKGIVSTTVAMVLDLVFLKKAEDASEQSAVVEAIEAHCFETNARSRALVSERFGFTLLDRFSMEDDKKVVVYELTREDYLKQQQEKHT